MVTFLPLFAGTYTVSVRLASVGAGPDHPVHPALPESAYLKGLLLHLT
jgi:23S rRNA G2069 N7-methylase RlmK/C1962 C5-methylase RlmI